MASLRRASAARQHAQSSRDDPLVREYIKSMSEVNDSESEPKIKRPPVRAHFSFLLLLLLLLLFAISFLRYRLITRLLR